VQHAPSGGPAAEQVTLVRDGFGVAHVFAKSDKGALYGAGYAAAEDRLFQMVRARLMCQGREAEFFGPGQVVDPKTGKITNTAIRHDREARAVGWWRHAQRVVAELPLDTLRLLQAYSDGVNAYVASPGAVLHPFFVQFGVPIEDWQPVDCIAVCLAFGRHFATSGLDEDYRLHEWQKLLANPALSYEQTLELMQGDRVCDDDAAVVKQSDVPIALQAAMSDYARQLGLDPSLTCPQIVDGPKFSQAWVVSGARTSSGNAMLVGDPRLEVFLPNALYEWSMHGKTISVRGAGIAGTPLILSGSTPRVAWSPAAIGTDQADLLLLTTDPVSHPGQYLLDGKWRKYAVDELEELKVFGSVHETVRYRETRWGPVVTAVSSNAKPGEEYALMRVPLMDPAADSTPAFFALYRAQDVDDVDQVLAGWAWPPVNLVFGDADGRIGYSVVGALPVRNPALDLAGIVAQDGSRSDSAWIDLVPHALRPHVLDPLEGALFSANHMPVGSWYPIPMRFGTGSAGDTPRSRRLRELLPPWLQGLTPLDVLAPHHDVVNVAYRDLTLLGLHLRDQQGYAYSGSAKAALGELEGWLVAGARMDNAHRATALAAQLDLSFRKGALTDPLIAEYGSSQNGLMLFLETKLAGLRASPPVPLDADTAAFLDGLFRDAWNVMKAVGPPASWQAWYAANHLRLDLEIWRTLEGLPSLRPGHPVPFGPMRVTDGQTLLSTSGQSYTQLVELDGFDSAASVLPPGVSEHESSLHASDQVPLWEGDMLKPSPLTQQGLKASGPTRISQLCYDPAP
jgi:penicillin amidase